MPTGSAQSQPRTRFEAIFEHAPDAIVVVASDGAIVAANTQVAALFGHPVDTLVGQPIEVLLPERHRDQHTGHRERFHAAPRIRDMGANAELHGLRHDGSEFPVEISLSPLPGGDGEVMAAIRDATDRKAAENRSAAILEFAPDATIIVNAAGQILAANLQTTAMFGHDRETLLGMTVEELLPERLRADHVGHRDGFSTAPRVREMGAGTALFALRSDGEEFAVEISLGPLPGPGHDVMATIRDVTVRRAARETLQQALDHEREATDALRVASRLKDEFLDIAAHELRTPLTAIGGFAHVLDTGWDGQDEDARRGLVGRIRRNADEMSAMIERLLNMSRLQAGRVQLELEQLDVVATIHGIIDSLPELADRQMTLTTDADRPMVSDRSAVNHIVTNFLTNAAKFSPADVPLEVRVSSGANEVTIEVQDHGIGIPTDDLPHLFEHFFQGTNQAAGGRGVGVGLSVARRYAELLGGRISATSEVGTGSTFTVCLPWSSAGADAVDPARSTARSSTDA